MASYNKVIEKVVQCFFYGVCFYASYNKVIIKGYWEGFCKVFQHTIPLYVKSVSKTIYTCIVIQETNKETSKVNSVIDRNLMHYIYTNTHFTGLTGHLFFSSRDIGKILKYIDKNT